MFMIFIKVCVALTCDMVINDSELTGEFYKTKTECRQAMSNVLYGYELGKTNPRLHYYGQCSDKPLELKDAGMEAKNASQRIYKRKS